MQRFPYGKKDPHDSFGGGRRGVVILNSEVRAKSLGSSTFIFRKD